MMSIADLKKAIAKSLTELPTTDRNMFGVVNYIQALDGSVSEYRIKQVLNEMQNDGMIKAELVLTALGARAFDLEK